MSKYDVIIIGSGAAGLTAALSLAESKRVLVLAKGSLTGGSTAWAQRGIAAVLDAGDTFEDHIRNTMVAGAGLNDRETVEFVIERAPRRPGPTPPTAATSRARSGSSCRGIATFRVARWCCAVSTRRGGL